MLINDNIVLGGINLDNPFEADNNALELEGTFVNEDSTVCSPYHPNYCFDNATMQIKILPDREHLGLELSLTSSFKSNFRTDDFFPNGLNRLYSLSEGNTYMLQNSYIIRLFEDLDLMLR